MTALPNHRARAAQAARHLLFALVLVLTAVNPALCRETGFLDRVVTVDATPYRYQVYVPRQFREAERWPVILSLHGGGEYGRDGISQTTVGIAQAVRQFPERYPAVIVFPQSPPGTPGFQQLGERIALAALDQSVAEFNADSARIYLTGFSMGGNGAWSLAYRHPERFAALLVACGFIDEFIGKQTGIRYPAIAPAAASDPYTTIAQRVKRLPVWMFHGDADATISVEVSRRLAAALRTAGADVRYTELPGIGHNVWDTAYRSEDVAAWLFKQVSKRQQSPPRQ